MPTIRVQKVFNLVPVSQGVVADPCKIPCTRPADAPWVHGWDICPYCGEKAVVEPQRFELQVDGTPGELGEAMKKGIVESLKPAPKPEPVIEEPIIAKASAPEITAKPAGPWLKPSETGAKTTIVKAAEKTVASAKATLAKATGKTPDEKVPHFTQDQKKKR